MRNFPKTEEDFNQVSQEEFMEDLRNFLVEARKHLKAEDRTSDFRLILATPPTYIEPLKKLLPEESLVIIHDMFIGFFVDGQMITVCENTKIDELKFYAIPVPISHIGSQYAKVGHKITLDFDAS